MQQPRNGIQFIHNREIIEELKPIVFFDAGKFTRDDDALTIGMHPHSGIGIITYFHGTDLLHRDSGNNNGIIKDGGAQWIRAGGGVWHEESYQRKEGQAEGSWTGSIHQLWIQLPPEFEESPVEYANLSKEQLPSSGKVKILAGVYNGIRGKIETPVNLTYLDINLDDGEVWEFDTPTAQTTGYVFARDGAVAVYGDLVPNSIMGILQHNEGRIQISGRGQANVVLILAEPSNHDLVSSGSQIHTMQEALDRSTARIRELGKNLT